MRLQRMEAGNFGDVKPEGEGVAALRFHAGKGHRVYFGQDGNRLIILLVGGDKSTQERDIQRAKAYWKDYKQRTRSDEGPKADKR
jgi:putative addiction module killer protein